MNTFEILMSAGAVVTAFGIGAGLARTKIKELQALRDARKLGALQLGISGGEPLLRDDIEDIVIEAKKLGYYSNLITSGVGLTEKRIKAFKEGGLDHIQLSMHDITEEINNFITNTIP